MVTFVLISVLMERLEVERIFERFMYRYALAKVLLFFVNIFMIIITVD